MPTLRFPSAPFVVVASDERAWRFAFESAFESARRSTRPRRARSTLGFLIRPFECQYDFLLNDFHLQKVLTKTRSFSFTNALRSLAGGARDSTFPCRTNGGDWSSKLKNRKRIWRLLRLEPHIKDFNFRRQRSSAVNFKGLRCCFTTRRQSSRAFHSTSRPPRATARDETREIAPEILFRGLSRTHARAHTRGRPASLRSREKSRAAHCWCFFATRQSRSRGLSPSAARTRKARARSRTGTW